MKVGFVTERHWPLLGGMEHQNHYLATAMNAAVACTTPSEASYPVYSAKSYLKNWNVRRMARKEKVDVLHGSMLHGGGYTAVKVGRKMGLPVAVQAHGADLQTVPEIGYGAFLDPDLAQKVGYTLEHADLVTVPCRRMRNIALENGAKRVEIVYPGHDVDYPYEDMRAKYGVAEEAYVVLTIGRNRPIKRLGLLDQALRKTKACWVSIGPEHEYVARQMGVLGKRDIVNWCHAADLYVSTSYCEAFGLAALDALACGCPVLVTKGQGVEDIIDGNGLVVEPDAVAEGIGARFDREAVRASVAHLTWERSAQELLRLYETI